MTNKNIGNATEKKACVLLASKGYWCHRLTQSEQGQPCDIVAISRSRAILLDAKHCDHPYLPTERIESNQRTCFKYASSLGVECGFVCEYLDKWFIIPWSKVNLSKSRQWLTDDLERLDIPCSR